MNNTEWKLGVLIDITRLTISEIRYQPKRIDDLYYKVKTANLETQLIPIAYIYPYAMRPHVVEQLQRLIDAKKIYDDITSDVYYKQLPKLRIE